MNKFISKISFKYIAIASAIAIFFVLDRCLKLLVVSQDKTRSLILIKDWLNFHFAANPYIAFSLPLNGWVLNVLLSVIIVILAVYIMYLRKKPGKGLEFWLLLVVLAGALSNIIDRFQYGYVVDYLDLRYFTVFNLADVMISFGALVLIINNLRKKEL